MGEWSDINCSELTELFGGNSNSEGCSEEIALLLSSWGFSERVIRKITDLKLTLWHINCIEDSDIDALFPVSELSDRIKFKFYIKDWRSRNAATKKLEVPTIVKSRVTTVESSDEEFLSVADILQQNVKGKQIYENFEVKGFLSEDHIKILVDVLAEYLISKNQGMSLKLIDKYSDDITKLFPSESKGTYYSPRKMGGNPKGKLYDRVKNLKYTLARKGLYQQRKSLPSVAKPDSTLDTTLDGIEPIIDEDVNKNQNWLKYNMEDDNWPEILEKWKATVEVRNLQCLTTDFINIIEEWPLFKHPRCSVLIDIDFKYMFPEKEQNLFLNWEKFKIGITKLFEENLKDRASLEEFKKLKETTEEDHKDFTIINLIHAILKPTVRLRKPSDKKIWKPSIVDSQYSFILRLKSISDLQHKVAERKDRYKKVGLDVQPFIILTEYSKEYFIWTQGVIHKCNSFLKSLDFCFKIFHCFNFKYPRECELVWLFIQKYLYSIDTKYDIDSPQVTKIICQLENY